jgi:hypothetical protein
MDGWFRSAFEPTSLGTLIVSNLCPNKVLGEGPSRPRLLAFKKPRLIPGLFVLGGSGARFEEGTTKQMSG